MRSPLLPFIFCALLSALSAPAGGTGLADAWDDFQQASAAGKSATSVEIDNDTLLLRHDDGFYTSGARIAQQYRVRAADRLRVFGWRIGQELYTPSDIKLPSARLDPSDHPYAGWLYGGFFKETHWSDGRRSKFGFDLGCVGPCAGGEWTQTNLHRVLHQPLPQGWDRQVRNEWGLVLYGEAAPVRWRLNSAVDVTPSVQGRFGNIFADAGAGVTVRAGQLNLLPDQSTLHAFLRLDARAVAYNATLQGGYFSTQNPHTVRPKRLVGEAEIGVTWDRAPYAVRLAVVRRSTEISALSNARGGQSFARLQFSYAP